METTQTLGTKPDPIGTGGVSTAPTGMPIVQLVIALGIVLALLGHRRSIARWGRAVCRAA